MNKKYNYRRLDIFPYGFYLLIPITAAFFPSDFSVNNLEVKSPIMMGIVIFMWLLLFLMFVLILLWILNKLKTVIVLSDTGILKKDIFRDILIRWNEISKIEKNFYFEESYPRSIYDVPGDLLIYGPDEKKVRIYKMLQSLDGQSEGIVEFEKALYERINPNIRPDATKYERKQWRLGIISGLLTVLIGVAIYIYPPPQNGHGWFLLLLKLLGLRLTVAFIVLLGIILITVFAYKLITNRRGI